MASDPGNGSLCPPGSPVISPSLLASIKIPPKGWKPPRRFLLGLGPPWEPNPWECEDEDEEDLMAFASQSCESKVDPPSPKRIKRDSNPQRRRFGSPVSSSKIEKIRNDGIPKATAKQTQWSLSVWQEWAGHRKENLIEESEHVLKLCEDFCSNSVESLK